MVEINLLPWRAMNRAENIKRNKLFLICFLVLILLWFISHVGFSFIVHTYDMTLSDLRNQLTELSSETKSDHFNSSLSMIEQIHSNQLELIDFFEVMERAMQRGVAWSEIINQKNHIILTGNIDSFSMLSNFVNIYNSKNKSLLMTIVNVKKDDDISAIQFRLQVARTPLFSLGQIENDNFE